MSSKKIRIFLIAMASLWAFSLAFRMKHQPHEIDLAEDHDDLLSYIVPKLSNYKPRFSLWDRIFVDGDQKSKILNAADELKKMDANLRPVNLPIPIGKPATPAAAKPRSTSTRPPEMRVQVVGSDDSDDKFHTEEQGNTSVYYGTNAAPSDKPSEDTLVSEWLQKIYQNPTRTTMNAMIDEFRGGNIENSVYFQILTQLIEDRSSDFQKLALYAISIEPNPNGLELLFKNQSHLASETQALQKVILESYISPERIPVLTQTLHRNSESATLGVLPLVLKISDNIATWIAETKANDPNRSHYLNRGRRTLYDGPPSDPNSNSPAAKLIADYKALIGALTSLSKEGNSLISRSAEDTLKQMDTLGPTFTSMN